MEQNKTLIPSSHSRYLAFGYADLSLRIGSYDTDKATTVFEGTQSGEVKCAACPNAKLVITGGLSTVSCIYIHFYYCEDSRGFFYHGTQKKKEGVFDVPCEVKCLDSQWLPGDEVIKIVMLLTSEVSETNHGLL